MAMRRKAQWEVAREDLVLRRPAGLDLETQSKVSVTDEIPGFIDSLM